jgi:peroxiredoxin
MVDRNQCLARFIASYPIAITGLASRRLLRRALLVLDTSRVQVPYSHYQWTKR